MKELLRCAALCIITSLWGCLPPMPAVPAEVTFVDRAPLYSWTGTWRGRGGTIFDIVQQGNRFSVSGPLANASAQLGGSRAQGTMTHANMPGMIGTFDMVLSNDGRYARGTVRWAGIPLEDLWTRISESPQPLAEDIAQNEGVKPGDLSRTVPAQSQPVILEYDENANHTVTPAAGNVVTIEQFQTWTHDNAYAVEQKLQAMGMINIRGRVDRVFAKDITLVGDTEIHPKIVCQFRELPRSYGQPFSYATPPEASSLRRDDLVTVAARFRKYLFPSKSTALFEDCRIVQIVPAAQAGRAQTSAPQMGAVSQVPTGASQSSPPPGYYQCYVLQVLSGGNSCKLGDLQLDGQGIYSSTRGPGGTYVFDPAAGVVSFNGGLLNGRMALAKISNKGTYMLRMRLSGGLPSPRQTYGTYTFEHKRSGRRQRW